MRAPRSGRALHALSIRAERDRPPTRPTHTPVVELLGARRGPCSRYLTIYQILAAHRKALADRPQDPVAFCRWPTPIYFIFCYTYVEVADRGGKGPPPSQENSELL